jgi:tripartite ATP-independent transporter DctP family solute receptor
MRKVTQYVIGSLVSVGLVIAALFGGAEAANPEVTLRFAGDLPIGNHLTRTQEFFSKRVDEISKGKVKIDVYPAGQLFTAKDFMRAVTSGAVDMVQANMAQSAGLVKSYMIEENSFFYDGWDHIWRVMDSEVGDALKKDAEHLGMKTLFWVQDCMASLASKTQIKTMDDFKGKRIRSYSLLLDIVLRALGAAPSYMSGGEVYMALQRGTVDGGLSSVSSFYDRKYFEVVKHVTVLNIVGGQTYAVHVNLKKWESLPANVQEVLKIAGKDTQEFARKEVKRTEAKAFELLKENGMTIYELPLEERDKWRKLSALSCEKAIIEKVGERAKAMLEQAEKLRRR